MFGTAGRAVVELPEALAEEDADEPPQAAINPPALNAKPPFAVFSNKVRREITLITATRFRTSDDVHGNCVPMSVSRHRHSSRCGNSRRLA